MDGLCLVSGVAAARRRLFVGGSLGIGMAAGLLAAQPATAQNECGAAASGAVTCTAAGNPYPTGITYTPTADLTLTTNSDVVANGTVSVNGPGASTIVNNGSVTVTGTGPAIGSLTGTGTGLLATGASATIHSTGVVSVSSGSSESSTGLFALANAGPANIDSGTVTASGLYSTAIYAGSYGDATVTSGAVTVAGYGSTGIYVDTRPGGNATITSGTIANDGTSNAIIVDASTGTTTINSQSIASTGDFGRGINVDSTSGAVSITSGTITTGGVYGTGIYIVGNSGPTTISSDALTTAGGGADGIYASTQGALSIDSKSLAVAGGESIGIEAGSETSTSINSGTLSTSGDDSIGIDARSPAGPITITAGTTSTTGGSDLYGGSVAIRAFAFGGDVTVKADTTKTLGDGAAGISVLASGAADVTASKVSTSGNTSYGIAVSGQTVAVDAGTITTAGANSPGIDASAAGDIAIKATSVSTGGDGSYGIHATSSAGDVSVTAGSVATTGNDASAIAATGNNVSVTTTGAISTKGTFAGLSSTNGISAFANAGTATVTASGPISVAGADTTGILAEGSQGATITASGAISATGANAIGVNVLADTGTAAVTTGTVSTTGYFGNGVQVNATTGAAIVKTGDVSTLGDRASGVLATGATGATATTGNVSTAGDTLYGVYAYTSAGTASITAGAVTGTGAGTGGLYAASSNGSASIDATSVAVSGAGTFGAEALSTGTSSITIGNATANDAPAVEALGLTAANATLDGAARVNSGTAVVVGSLGDATLTIGKAGSITLAGGGAALYSPTRSTINNAGTISGTADRPVIAAYAPAALGYPGATAGPLTFNNSGQFTGVIGFTAGDDTVNNSGTYTAIASQDFGAGTNSFNNSGTLAVLPNATVAGTIPFTSLTSFANSGLVDLRNGHAGDTLSLSGRYAGSGGATLGLDVDFASGTADRLTVGGAITGSTVVALTPVGSAVTLNRGITFASGGAGTSASAFTLASNGSASGLYHYDVAYAAPSNSFALVVTPGDAVFRALKINEAANTLWQLSADGWSSHMAELRDAQTLGGETGHGRLWGSFTGSTVQRNAAQSFTSFGETRTVPLSYRLDAFGGQIGLDLGSFGPGGAVRFGVTGGYLNSHQQFGSGDLVRFDAANAGAYLAFSAGGLFANILGKYDHYWVSGNSRAGGDPMHVHGDGYGGVGELGYRLGAGNAYVEPVVRIAYVRTDLDSYHPQGTTIDFDDFDGLRGKAGARFGTAVGQMGAMRVLLYGEGNYVHEFKGRDGIAFTSGDATLAYRNARLRDYGEGKIGFTATSGGVTGFVEGFGEDGKGYKGGGGRAGLRVGF